MAVYLTLCSCPVSCIQQSTDVHTSLAPLSSLEIVEMVHKYDMNGPHIKVSSS